MREWARSAMADAKKRMKKRCREEGLQHYWEVFRRHEISPARSRSPSYAQTAEALGWDIEKVRRTLHRARNKFAPLVREVIRETVAYDHEVDEEIADLLKYFRSN